MTISSPHLKPARTLLHPNMRLLARTPNSLAPPSSSENLCSLRSVTCKPIVRIGKTGSSRTARFRAEYCAGVAGLQPAKIGKRWMEYQGCDDWEGLLDPLDDTLRREILRYGEFVEAAYRSFDFDPSSPTYGTCKYPRSSLLARSGIPETGYRPTRNLRATCGVQLPRWAGLAPGWMSTRSSWIGYVAVCQDRREIQRLGRRDVVIALRGTGTCLEWIENLRATLTCLHDHHDGTEDDAPMVESGFLRLYTSRTANFPSLREMIREEIARIVETYGDEPLSLTITGHSLGAALATLAAYDISSTLEGAPMVTVVSFGGPRVGNRSFRRHLEESGTKILRIVNSDDLVTRLPGFVVEDGDTSAADERSIHVAGMPRWFQKSVQDARWVYADVGQELRLSSRESPYLREGNMATCHELKTYLHLVNGFVSSTCPFKSTAKRMLSMHYR
ncbi:phospholipase A(1) DAD1, chloroplastic-like [Syzygium oleosum]|uniref:phospholipase A(1) DAD1, chloroplastic-like n=1 Tax=Syzygium oleosum TaxID=219896 RepID=UPI0024BAD4F9|nr:phospholipase A(1) DAD1, chloroplastic-like [Syzygium oleosum]